MNAEDWEKAKSLFGEAIEMEPARREAYLRDACRGDESLFDEVWSLLAADKTSTVLRTPTFDHQPTAVLLKNRYWLERELGRGGLGVVYLARDQDLHGRRVVIKLPLDPNPRDSWLAQKFAQEVKALALIDHPGVVGALDSGVMPDGRPFFVMQFIEGRPLTDAIVPGGMPFGEAGELLRQIGESLSAAHAKRIWHRDLKPGNIMLQKLDGGKEYVRLIDFGIATIQEAREGESGTRVVGTPAYMAPEQMQGRVSGASDIYAMGVIAYEMLAGKRPFTSENPIDLYRMQKSGAFPNPSQLRPGLPVAAGNLIAQALAFQPEARLANAAEFGDQLAKALTQGPSPAITSRRSTLAMGLGAAGALAAGGAAATWWALENRQTEKSIDWTLIVTGGSGSAEAQAVRPGTPLRTKDEFQLQVRCPQGGYLYLVSDDPAKDTLTALGSFQLRPGEQNQIPPQRPFGIDEPGEFALSFVWSKELVPELESLGRLLNETDRGVVRDAAERTRTREFLAKLPHPKASSPGGLEQRLSIQRPPIVWTIRLKAK